MTPEERTAELLPCSPNCGDINLHVPEHAPDCPYIYRPAVATALAKKDKEIEWLKTEVMWLDASTTLQGMSKQIAEHKAEAATLRQQVSELEAHLRHDHAQDCGIFSRKECSCGWNQGTFNADDERDRQWLEEQKQSAAVALRQQIEALENSVYQNNQINDRLQAEVEYYKKLALELDDKDDSRLQAARVEGLRVGNEVIQAARGLVQVWRDKGHGGDGERRAHVAIKKAVEAYDAEIAALERGKEGK